MLTYKKIEGKNILSPVADLLKPVSGYASLSALVSLRLRFVRRILRSICRPIGLTRILNFNSVPYDLIMMVIHADEGRSVSTLQEKLFHKADLS